MPSEKPQTKRTRSGLVVPIDRPTESRDEPLRIRDLDLRREVDEAIRPRPIYERAVDERPRVTTILDQSVKDALDRIATGQRRTKSEIVREAVEKLIIEAQEKPVTPTNDRVVIQSPQEIIFIRP